MKNQYEFREMGPFGSRLVDTSAEPETIVGRPTPEVLLAALNAQARATAAMRELAIQRELEIVRHNWALDNEELLGMSDDQLKAVAIRNIDLVIASAKTGHESYSESMASLVKQGGKSTVIYCNCDCQPAEISMRISDEGLVQGFTATCMNCGKAREAKEHECSKDGAHYAQGVYLPPDCGIPEPGLLTMEEFAKRVAENIAKSAERAKEPRQVIPLGCGNCGELQPISRSFQPAGCNVCEPKQHCLGCGERDKYPFCGLCNAMSKVHGNRQDLIDADHKQRGAA